MIRSPAETTVDGTEPELPSYFDEPLDTTYADEERLLGPVTVLTQEPPYLRLSERRAVTFLRALELPFEVSVAAIDTWWRSDSRADTLEVRASRGRFDGAPVYDATNGQFRCRVHVHQGLCWPSLGMELEMFPWLGPWGTKLSLRPRRPVHAGRRYFTNGHAVLDGVVTSLQHYAEARAEGVCSAGQRT